MGLVIMALMTYLDDGPIREQVWHAYNYAGHRGAASTIARCS